MDDRPAHCAGPRPWSGRWRRSPAGRCDGSGGPPRTGRSAGQRHALVSPSRPRGPGGDPWMRDVALLLGRVVWQSSSAAMTSAGTARLDQVSAPCRGRERGRRAGRRQRHSCRTAREAGHSEGTVMDTTLLCPAGASRGQADLRRRARRGVRQFFEHHYERQCPLDARGQQPGFVPRIVPRGPASSPSSPAAAGPGPCPTRSLQVKLGAARARQAVSTPRSTSPTSPA